jgi:hypothetical protein
MRCRPSELYGITDTLHAFYFDRAVATFGLAVEADLTDAAEEAKTASSAKRKQDMRLAKWLREPDAVQKFKDPAEVMRARERL